MPRKAKNKTIRKAAKKAKEFSDPVNAGEEFEPNLTESRRLMNDLEPISTEHDESDDLEATKRIVETKASIKEAPTKTVKKRKQDSATNMEKLGWLGEWMCQEHLSIELGYDPKEDHHPTRNNKFDSEKDGRDPNGRSVEIKTQNRHPRGYFTIPENQLKKCTEVERLIFVEYDNTNVIQLWECSDRTHETIKLKDGGSRIGFPIRSMQLLLKSANEDLAQEFRAFSSSAVIKKD